MPSLKQIIELVGAEVFSESPSDSIIIKSLAPLSRAEEGQLTFCKIINETVQEKLKGCRASVILISKDAAKFLGEYKNQKSPIILTVANARLSFIRIVEEYFSTKETPGIHPTAIINPSVKIGKRVFIGAMTTIGEDCEIGDDTVIHPGVHIYSKVRIGKRVKIFSGAVIGAEGFGAERDESGKFIKFPHLGGVVIEDDVEVGSNTSIDRGTLDDTRICEGVKIDNLVHIAHNVVVGKHSAVIAHAMLGGSTTIGEYSWIAPSVAIREKLSIGARVLAGLGAVLTKSVPDGQTVLGNPAREISEFKALSKKLDKIPD